MKSKLLIITIYISLHLNNYSIAAEEPTESENVTIIFRRTTDDGTKLILFSDGTRSTEFVSGDRTIQYPGGVSITEQADGVILTTDPSLGCELRYPSGYAAFKYLSGIILWEDSDKNMISASEVPNQETLMKKK